MIVRGKSCTIGLSVMNFTVGGGGGAANRSSNARLPMAIVGEVSAVSEFRDSFGQIFFNTVGI